MGRGRSLCLESVAETRILSHGSKMSSVNHTKLLNVAPFGKRWFKSQGQKIWSLMSKPAIDTPGGCNKWGPAPDRLAGQRLCPFPPQPALPGLSCRDTLSLCISCALPLALWASHQHLPPTPGCCTSQGTHGKVPTNNILQPCSAASSVGRPCQASALRDLMRGTLHNEAGKGWDIIPCLAAAVNTTAINNHSLKPQYSFTSPQLPRGIRRMVARGDIAWPKLPAKYPQRHFWVQISLIITSLCA